VDDPLSSHGAEPSRCLVELSADNGLSGIGIAAGWARQPVELLTQATLIGEDPGAATALWQRMGERLSGKGDGVFQHARGILDLAVWDLKAKAQNEPLWKSLGGARPRANAYASLPIENRTDEDICEWIGKMSANHGFRAAKLPVGLAMDTDLRHLGLVREALRGVTTQPELMIDAGGRWWPTEARRHTRQIESEFDLSFVQYVTQTGDFLAAKRLADSIRAAVCIGGGLTTDHAFLPYFHHHAANVIEIDLNYFGITGALQLADAAYGFELPVTLSAVEGNITAHLAAAMPNFMSMEVVDPGPGDGIVTSEIQFLSGWGIAGETPGTGLSIQRGRLAQASAEKVE
jgi:L-alanine-DL-glutamate epimerase-like enolase superfamily enzyme